MRIELISNISKLPISVRQWNLLADQNETCTPFQSYEWFKSWWTVFGNQYGLYIILVFDGDRVIGLAPFMIDRQHNKNILKFISDVNADYCDFITTHDKPHFLKIIFEYLLQNRAQWDTISLQNIPEYSSTTPIIEEYLSDQQLLFSKSSVVCPVLIMKDVQPASLRNTHRTLKRHLNYFHKSGALSFKIFTPFPAVPRGSGTLDIG